MKERWLEVKPGADERQEAWFEGWKSGENIPFVDDQAKEAYRKRITLIKDAIQMKKAPERIPICPSAGFFPIEYSGITVYDAMYDYDAMGRAWDKFHADFAPDTYSSPFIIVPGKVLDILDFTLCRWPGHGLARESQYQYVEKEYMKEDEYQDLIDDPTGFFLNIYFPRIFGAMKTFENIPLPVFPSVNEIPCVPPAMIPFGIEETQTALKKVMEAGDEAMKWFGAIMQIDGSIIGTGRPSFMGGFTKAPFDVIGDTLRGTREVLTDIYLHPEELKEACERLTPLMIKAGVGSCRATGHIMPFIPLHKGADGFMSDEQYRTFYWPTLRKLIIGLIDEGLVPLLFAEGGYNQRLEVISDLPKGKTVWWFDLTDMEKAKATIGQVSCIAGNAPLSLLCAGSPDEVKAYCKKLIDVAGKDGGYIFSTGASIEGSRPENVKAMLDFVKEYAVYR